PGGEAAAAPLLSVVVAAGAGQDPGRCLDALAAQERPGPVEILVACAGGAGRALRERHPGVVFIDAPEGASMPVLWGAGLRRARGAVLAVTDAATVVAGGWLAAVARIHEAPHPVVGGAVEPGPGGGWTDWAAYFCDYGAFMLPLAAGAAPVLPGNNLAFRREMLAHGREYVEPAFWKARWCRALQEAGVVLYAHPAMVVTDAKRYRPGAYLRRRFRHGRCFAAMRTASSSAAMRLGYALAAPALPALLTARLVRAQLPRRRHRNAFLISLPLSVLSMTCWGLGEFVGYVMGPGTSCDHV
ncbi:MAG: glycosyltransferase, partial [Rhodothermales bacterium]|nr:glycosyltransferase [Rhodothermales bacterium]